MLGKIIADRYEIEQHIAGGGMATVYQGKDTVLDRIVAVKIMDPKLGQDDEFVKRFTLEGKATGRLSHPNIVNVYDAGEENGLYYMVMEFVENITLKEYILNKGFLTAEETIDIGIQICDGLAHAHQQGIIHRDIKPHNILCTPDGRFKLTDFGIARLVDSSTQLTQTGTVMGSVHYFSPEQASGHTIAYPSDVYSLGIVLFEMLTGSVPFDAKEHLLVAMMHLHDEVPDIHLVQEDLPVGLKNVVERALAKKPEERYQTADELKLALQQALASPIFEQPQRRSLEIETKQPLVDETPVSPSRIRNLLWIGLATILLVGLSYIFWSTDEQNADPNKPITSPKQVTEPYTVVVGLFQKETNAEKLAKKLSDQHLEASIKLIELEGETRYRVYLGNYKTKEQAETELKELRQAKIDSINDAYVSKLNNP